MRHVKARSRPGLFHHQRYAICHSTWMIDLNNVVSSKPDLADVVRTLYMFWSPAAVSDNELEAINHWTMTAFFLLLLH